MDVTTDLLLSALGHVPVSVRKTAINIKFQTNIPFMIYLQGILEVNCHPKIAPERRDLHSTDQLA